MNIKVLADSRTGMRTLVASGLLLCGVVLVTLLLAADRAHAGGASSSSHASASAPRATVSRVENVNETLKFEITQIKGNIIYAQGKSFGSFVGNALLHLNLINASRATAWLYAYNSHGSIVGTGKSDYHASGAVSYFSGGSPPAIQGRGKYKDLRVLKMNLTGVMNRRTLTISVRLIGKWDV